MRVIKALFGILLTLLLLIAVFVLVSREVVLFIGLAQLKNAVEQMELLHTKGEYINNCVSMGAEMVGNTDPYHMQLRFIDDQSYVTEVVCQGLDNSPITISQKALPFFSRKQPGSSGLIWPVEYAGLRLNFLGRSAELHIENNEVVTAMKVSEEEFDSGPVAACAGYGFVCCDQNQEQGLGDQLLGVKDCPQSCYESCSFSPVVLSFVSQPFYDQTNRQLRIKSGETVSFSYTISSSQQASFQGQIEEDDDFWAQLIKNAEKILANEKGLDGEEKIQVIIDFGDGRQQSSFELNSRIEHTYICATESCDYTAKVSAVNLTNNTRSADSLLNSINIIVTR